MEQIHGTTHSCYKYWQMVSERRRIAARLRCLGSTRLDLSNLWRSLLVQAMGTHEMYGSCSCTSSCMALTTRPRRFDFFGISLRGSTTKSFFLVRRQTHCTIV